MPKDIRKLTQNYHQEGFELSVDHEKKFLAKLDKEFPEKKRSFAWIYVAASVVLLIGLGVTFYSKTIVDPANDPNTTFQEVSLGDISPEMKKIENYYLNAIHYEIASLEVTPENKALLDEYFEKISKLDTDYKRLNEQLKKGIDNQLINALITNLQLRLQLLIQLKDHINELQLKGNNNEKVII